MSWLEDVRLRDLDDTVIIESTCLRCRYVWLQSSTKLLLKVLHRDVTMAEVAKDLACPRRECRNVGVRLILIRNEDTSSFVGGLP